MTLDTDNIFLKNKYFEWRKITPNFYENFKLPLWIKNELGEDKSIKILDYGCGFGQILKALKEEGYKNCYGIDINKAAVTYCLGKSFKVKEVDPDCVDNPWGFKFDVVICLHVIEHIPKQNIINTLKNIKEKFLAKGGIFLIAVPNAQSNTGCYWAYEDFTHTTLFTSGSLYYVLRAAGFKNVEFLDIDCTLETRGIKKILKKILLKVYKLNKHFWNRVTGSAYHRPSPEIFSFEIKCKAW